MRSGRFGLPSCTTYSCRLSAFRDSGGSLESRLASFPAECETRSMNLDSRRAAIFLILLLSGCGSDRDRTPDSDASASLGSSRPAIPPSASASLTLSPSGFLRSSRPFFPVGNFLTSATAEGPRTHVYLSDALTDADRRRILDVAVAAEYNVLSVYTYNESDYDGETISPFQGGGFGGPLDEALLNAWRTRLDDIVAAGLHPILWLVPDDAPRIHAADDSTLAAYVSAMVARFDSLPVLWVLALEADEYWPDDKIHHLGTHLASQTARPVGVHQLQGEFHLMHADWVDFGAYQYGFGKSWRSIFDDTRRVAARLEKPFIAMEYDLEGGTEDERLGLAAAFGGAQGVGNGAPPGLAAFMEGLPAGMTRSRTWTRAATKGAGVAATAHMKTLEFRRESR